MTLTILSVLEWKKHHKHKIKLYTDKNVMEYLCKYDLSELWDSYNIEVFNEIRNIDIEQFWSVGKFYAYLNEQSPCIAIDNDMIIWNNIDRYIENAKLCFTHWEKGINSTYYPQKEKLLIPDGYKWNQDWDWNLNAANTSIIFLADEEFKNYYANEAIKYMMNNMCGNREHQNELLFVEQKLLTMCAKEKGILNRTKTIFDMTWNADRSYFNDKNNKIVKWDFSALDNGSIATHTWVEKKWIEKDLQRRQNFCEKAISIIATNNKDLLLKLGKIESLKGYVYNYMIKEERYK